MRMDRTGTKCRKGCRKSLRFPRETAQDDAEEIRGRWGHVQKTRSAPPGRSEIRKACRKRRFQLHPWSPDLPGKRTAPVEREPLPLIMKLCSLRPRTGFRRRARERGAPEKRHGWTSSGLDYYDRLQGPRVRSPSPPALAIYHRFHPPDHLMNLYY